MKKFIITLAYVPLFITINGYATTFDAYDQIQDVGTLKADNSGQSSASAVSADGGVIVGQSINESGALHAYRWTAESAMQDLGSLKSGNSGASHAYAVSADGSTIVGDSASDSGPKHAFRWTAASGMQDLGTMKAGNSGASSAEYVSADGSTVAGNASTDSSTLSAYRWTEATGMQDLGSLGVGTTLAKALSADGSTVVGISNSHAFRWTSASAMQDLGTLEAGNSGSSSAKAVSADGGVIVGVTAVNTKDNHAFRWTLASAMQDLGTLKADNSGQSTAIAVSADGSVVAGDADNDQGKSHAFRWTAVTSMQDLGTLKTDNSGASETVAVSADGSTVVGKSDTDQGKSRAFRWTSVTSMQDLGTLKADNSGTSSASSVSADGSTVVGQADSDQGVSRAFIYRVTPPVTPPVNPPVNPVPDPGVMQDYGNVLLSFSNLAGQTELAAAQQQAATQRLLGDTCFVGETGLNCLGISGVVANTGSDSDIGRRNQSQGLLTLGHGINENLTLGVSLSSGSTRLHDSGINAKTAYGASVWGDYSANGPARTGLQANVGLAVNTQDNDVTRGEDLSNVQRLSGSADMTTVAGRIGVGYGFMYRSNWLITPSAALIQQRTTRDAYTEHSGAITGSYNKERLNSTIIDIGTEAQKSINGVSRVRLGAGLEYDLHADQARLEGTTDVPGMETLKFKSGLDRNAARPYMTASYGYDLSVGGTLSAGVRVAKDTYSEAPQTAISVSYGIKF